LRRPHAAEMPRAEWAGWAGGSSAWPAPWAAKNPHPVLHLLRAPIVAHDRPRVAQAAAFPLDEKAPKSFASVVDQFDPRLAKRSRIAIIFEQRRQRGFERATRPPERGGLFLRYLIVQRDGGGRSGAGTEGRHFSTNNNRGDDRQCPRMRCQVTTETPAAGSSSRRGPGLKPRCVSTSSGVAFAPTSVNTASPPGIFAFAARER